jgi:hypothetical protein
MAQRGARAARIVVDITSHILKQRARKRPFYLRSFQPASCGLFCVRSPFAFAVLTHVSHAVP